MLYSRVGAGFGFIIKYSGSNLVYLVIAMMIGEVNYDESFSSNEVQYFTIEYVHLAQPSPVHCTVWPVLLEYT